jgi:hypothetical protein
MPGKTLREPTGRETEPILALRGQAFPWRVPVCLPSTNVLSPAGELSEGSSPMRKRFPRGACQHNEGVMPRKGYIKNKQSRFSRQAEAWTSRQAEACPTDPRQARRAGFAPAGGCRPSENEQDARVSREKRKGPVVGETTGPSSGYRGVGLWGGGTAAEEIVVVLLGPLGTAVSDTPKIHAKSRRVESCLPIFCPPVISPAIRGFCTLLPPIIPPLDTWAWPVVAISVGYPRSPEFPHAKTRKASHHDGRRPP